MFHPFIFFPILGLNLNRQMLGFIEYGGNRWYERCLNSVTARDESGLETVSVLIAKLPLSHVPSPVTRIRVVARRTTRSLSDASLVDLSSPLESCLFIPGPILDFPTSRTSQYFPDHVP